MSRAARSARASRTAWRALLQAGTPSRFALGAVLALSTVLAGMALLGLSGWFVTSTAIAGLAAGGALAFDVFMPSAGIRLLALTRTAGRYAERLVTHDATFAALADLRMRLFRGWANPRLARPLAARPTRLLFRLTGDLDALEAAYLRRAVPALLSLGALAVAALTVAFASPAAGLSLGIVTVAAVAFMMRWAARRAVPLAARRAREIERLRERMADLVAGQTALVMAGRDGAALAAIRAIDVRIAAVDRRLQQVDSALATGHQMVAASALAATLLIAADGVAAGRIGAPVAALLLFVVLSAFEPLAGWRRGILEAGRLALAMRRLEPALESAAGPPPHAWAVPAPAAPPAVAIDGVTIGPGGRARPALRELTLAIAPDERVAVIGSSGSGKSTLLALLAGERGPDTGTVRAPPSCLLTQRTEIFHDSLRENLLLAAPGADDARLWSALDAAGLAADLRAGGVTLDVELGEGGLGLSGGQARRLALARLLLRDAPLWLLDEPTEALDAALARDVLDRLARAASDRTVVIATHLRREAAMADRIVRLADGVVVADLRRGTAGYDAALRALRPD